LTVNASSFIGFVFFKANMSLQGLQIQMLALSMFLTIFNPGLLHLLPNFVRHRDSFEVIEREDFIFAQVLLEIPIELSHWYSVLFLFLLPTCFLPEC
jgi:ATP-binding cassette subfamily G (WHITE) protein 2 (PDR)